MNQQTYNGIYTAQWCHRLFIGIIIDLTACKILNLNFNVRNASCKPFLPARLVIDQ